MDRGTVDIGTPSTSNVPVLSIILNRDRNMVLLPLFGVWVSTILHRFDQFARTFLCGHKLQASGRVLRPYVRH